MKILALFFAFCFCLKPQAQTLKDQKLNGAVKSRKVSSIQEGKLNWKDPQYYELKQYDRAGNLIEEHSFHKDLSPQLTKIFYDYDSSGLLKVIRYQSGEFIMENFYQYDSLGRVSEEKDFDEDGELKQKTIFIYDNLGNVEKHFYNEKGQERSYSTFVYNEKKKIIRWENFDADDLHPSRKGKFNLQAYTRYTYDEHGNITEEISRSEGLESYDTMYYNITENKKVITYVYDDLGRISETFTSINNGMVTFRAIYKYDSQGNRSKIILYEGKKAHAGKIEYTYDSKNNLIRELYKSPDGETDKITEWIIEYYD